MALLDEAVREFEPDTLRRRRANAEKSRGIESGEDGVSQSTRLELDDIDVVAVLRPHGLPRTRTEAEAELARLTPVPVEKVGTCRRRRALNDSAGIAGFLADQLADASVQWSLGTFGAIAEFMRDADELVTLVRAASSLSATTARGGIRIDLHLEMRLHASETAVGESWSHRVALCLPAERFAMSRRATLTELGPDGEALRDADRSAVLFDLGFGCLQVDACIRSSDAEVLAQLRKHVGRSVFEPSNPAMSVILASHPHRVFVARLGRMEVYQPIPPPAGKSPEGPHTHVLPKLLAHGRTHAATEAVPDGFVPCAHLYPPHAAKDGSGRTLPFDAGRHAAFQDKSALTRRS